MSAFEAFEAKRKTALAIIEQRRSAARKLKTAGSKGLDAVINQLNDQETALDDAIFVAEMSDPAAVRAFAAIDAATAEMNRVAARMVDATGMVANVAEMATSVAAIANAACAKGDC